MTRVDWSRVERLVDASPGLADLRAHGLQLLAARQWRARGRPVPADLVDEEFGAAWRTHAAPRVLEEVRRACDGPVLLVKGPGVAAHYPEPASRPFVDIDILVPDPPAVQAALLGAGFELAGDPAHYPDHLHHLTPVALPARPIPVEVHQRLKWVDVLEPPSFEALSASARPTLGVEGVLEPAPAAQALVLAGHLWAHDPLVRLLRLLDVAVVAEEADPEEVDALARAWGMAKLWRATADVADALFGSSARDPLALRTWARGLRTAREPTVAELHLGRVLSPFVAFPAPAALRALGDALAGFARPQESETWPEKLRRTARQVTRPSMRRSEHVDAIAELPPPPANSR